MFFDMHVDVWYRRLEEFGHHLLSHPHGVMLHADIQLHLVIGRGVEQYFAVRNGGGCLIHSGEGGVAGTWTGFNY